MVIEVGNWYTRSAREGKVYVFHRHIYPAMRGDGGLTKDLQCRKCGDRLPLNVQFLIEAEAIRHQLELAYWPDRKGEFRVE